MFNPEYDLNLMRLTGALFGLHFAPTARAEERILDGFNPRRYFLIRR